MEKTKKNKLFYIMGFLGELIIFIGFYFLLTPSGKTNISWLNWAVVSFIFALNYFSASIIFTTREKFSERIPGLGLINIICIVYSIIALLVMYFCHTYLLAFRYQLLIHIVLIFFVGVGFMIVKNSMEFTRNHKEYETALESRIMKIRQELNLICSNMCKTSEEGTSQARLYKIQELFKYTSPVEKAEAFELEDQILDVIANLNTSENQMLLSSNANDENIQSMIDKLETLYQQRKTIIN